MARWRDGERKPVVSDQWSVVSGGKGCRPLTCFLLKTLNS
nr:MAG TPA: hypothetical protein [Caudoviricetes sp.]